MMEEVSSNLNQGVYRSNKSMAVDSCCKGRAGQILTIVGIVLGSLAIVAGITLAVVSGAPEFFILAFVGFIVLLTLATLLYFKILSFKKVVETQKSPTFSVSSFSPETLTTPVVKDPRSDSPKQVTDEGRARSGSPVAFTPVVAPLPSSPEQVQDEGRARSGSPVALTPVVAPLPSSPEQVQDEGRARSGSPVALTPVVAPLPSSPSQVISGSEDRGSGVFLSKNGKDLIESSSKLGRTTTHYMVTPKPFVPSASKVSAEAISSSVQLRSTSSEIPGFRSVKMGKSSLKILRKGAAQPYVGQHMESETEKETTDSDEKSGD